MRFHIDSAGKFAGIISHNEIIESIPKIDLAGKLAGEINLAASEVTATNFRAWLPFTSLTRTAIVAMGIMTGKLAHDCLDTADNALAE